MSLLRKIIFIIISVIVIFFGVTIVWFSRQPSETKISERFIVANPLDLSQIQGFSQYRSCEGHDYRAPTLRGEMESTPRSMKHYIHVKPEFSGTVDEVKAFAPFDGKVSTIMDKEFESAPDDLQIWLTPDSKNPRQWQFVFFHLKLKEGIREGSLVRAGELIGTANLRRGPENATSNFDFAVKMTRPMHRPAVDTVLNHAAPDVLLEYERYGVRPDDLVISKEERDANPCPIIAGRKGPDVYFQPGAATNHYVWLKEPAS